MAIPILNHMDFQKCGEIRNVLLHATGSGSVTSPGTGQIIYDSGTIKFYNGSGWVSLGTGSGSGTVTSVAVSGTDGIQVDSGSPITSSGTITLGLSGIGNDKLTNSSISLTQGAGMAAMGSVSLGSSVTVGVDGVLEDLDTLGAASADGEVIVATGAGAFAYESGATLRTSIGVDAAGTDNSTNVSLTGTPDYITISGQVITRNKIDLANDVTGDLPVAEGGTGSSTASGARTNLGVDAAGTDNSTNVTLVTTSHDYLSISGQAITLGPIANNDLSNSSITINGSAISLGGSVSTVQVGTGSGDALAGNTTVNDVSVANFKSAAGSAMPSNALAIGDASTTTTIAGDLVVTGTTTTNNVETVSTSNGVIFEGSNADDHEVTLLAGTVTADRTATLPDATGTIVLADATQTLSNKTIAASQVTEISNLTAVEGAQLENIGSTTISASQWGYLGGATSFGGSLLDDANAAAGRTTLGVDAAGTDNSTDVTLVTTSHDYLSISGQAVTLAAIDLTADVTGDLPVTEGGTGASNASGARSNLGVDAAGTDNSTNVTLAGKDYLTISSQEITANAIDLTDDVSGTLPTGNLPIASGAAVITGTATTSLVTPDKLAAKTVVADIDVSSINSTNKYAEITHSLGMADIMVQIYDTVTEETVYADVARTDKANSASTSKIKVTFACVPSNDLRVLITSFGGATAGTVAYS
jgi:hypothetical protein|tara:strand:+ start:3372 stop:5477 length:2106 start_codon:yes stop_codon:yes gene_type:complete